MNNKTMTSAKAILRDRNKRGARNALLLCLAILVVAGVAGIFHMPATAKTYQVTQLTCTAVPPEGPAYADFFVHIHNDDCFDAAGNLVCPLPEIRPHRHTADCFVTTRTLICGILPVPFSAPTERDSLSPGTKSPITCIFPPGRAAPEKRAPGKPGSFPTGKNFLSGRMKSMPFWRAPSMPTEKTALCSEKASGAVSSENPGPPRNRSASRLSMRTAPKKRSMTRLSRS